MKGLPESCKNKSKCSLGKSVCCYWDNKCRRSNASINARANATANNISNANASLTTNATASATGAESNAIAVATENVTTDNVPNARTNGIANAVSNAKAGLTTNVTAKPVKMVRNADRCQSQNPNREAEQNWWKDCASKARKGINRYPLACACCRVPLEEEVHLQQGVS